MMTSILRRFGIVPGIIALLAGCGGSGDDPFGNSGGAGGSGGVGGTGGDTGTPVSMSPEAGFIEVPGSSTIETSGSARMFYSFWPADERPEHAPVILFFNGGPGVATTSILMPYGTGPFTLDPTAPADAPPRANDASYTRFANLLYVDARSAGFSYDLVRPDRIVCRGTNDQRVIADAADFIYVLLEFLGAHEALRDNPVVIAGESYGGTRAPMMLYMMQNYTLESDDLGVMVHAPPWLKDKMRAHLDAPFPARAGAPQGPERVAKQFGWQLLIQPNIAGSAQMNFELPLALQDPDLAPVLADNPDLLPTDVRLTVEEAALIAERTARSMRNPDHLRTLLGVDLTSIAGLTPPERGPSFRYFVHDNPAQVAASERELRDALGELDENDAYWLPIEMPCGPFMGDDISLSAFTDVLGRTATMITNARYDARVYTEALPVFFKERSDFDVEVDMSLPAGAARPGVVRLTRGETELSIRFPTYEAGHEVSMGAPRELAEDVQAWLAETGALAPR